MYIIIVESETHVICDFIMRFINNYSKSIALSGRICWGWIGMCAIIVNDYIDELMPR